MKSLLKKELNELKEGEEKSLTCGNNVVIVRKQQWYYEGKKRIGYLSCKIGKWNNLFDVNIDYAVDHIYAGLIS